MGEIANAMIGGEMCACCGVYLEPKEKVYTQASGKKIKMPADGSPAGFPVYCKDCYKDCHDE
jgi:hypothetical protein